MTQAWLPASEMYCLSTCAIFGLVSFHTSALGISRSDGQIVADIVSNVVFISRFGKSRFVHINGCMCSTNPDSLLCLGCEAQALILAQVAVCHRTTCRPAADLVFELSAACDRLYRCPTWRGSRELMNTPMNTGRA